MEATRTTRSNLELAAGVVGAEDDANFVPMNTADDWLHFALGVGMIGIGFVTTRSRPATA